MPIMIDVFSGFLGAGKTMLIKKLLNEGVYTQNLALIENEFGEVSIDGAYLDACGIKITEINSGCICCSVTGDFKKAITSLLKTYDLKRILIEPSGVASLSDVLHIFEDATLKEKLQLDTVLTVIDGTKFDIYKANFPSFYNNQIQYAKTVVISKTQLLAPQQIQHIASEVKKLNAHCAIVSTPWDKVNGQAILGAHKEMLEEQSLKNQVKEEIRSGKRKPQKALKLTQLRKAADVFESLGIQALKPIQENKLKEILKHLSHVEKYGEILRAKGIVALENGKWVQFDYVYGDYEVRPTAPYYTSKLCIIGTALKKDALNSLFIG